MDLAKADPAERYPKALCDKVAKLVVSVWKRSLNLEWWRYQVLNKGETVSEVQKGWLANEERRLKGTRIGDVKKNKHELEKDLDHPGRKAGSRSRTSGSCEKAWPWEA